MSKRTANENHLTENKHGAVRKYDGVIFPRMQRTWARMFEKGDTREEMAVRGSGSVLKVFASNN